MASYALKPDDTTSVNDDLFVVVAGGLRYHLQVGVNINAAVLGVAYGLSTSAQRTALQNAVNAASRSRRDLLIENVSQKIYEVSGTLYLSYDATNNPGWRGVVNELGTQGRTLIRGQGRTASGTLRSVMSSGTYPTVTRNGSTWIRLTNTSTSGVVANDIQSYQNSNVELDTLTVEQQVPDYVMNLKGVFKWTFREIFVGNANGAGSGIKIEDGDQIQINDMVVVGNENTYSSGDGIGLYLVNEAIDSSIHNWNYVLVRFFKYGIIVGHASASTSNVIGQSSFTSIITNGAHYGMWVRGKTQSTTLVACQLRGTVVAFWVSGQADTTHMIGGSLSLSQMAYVLIGNPQAGASDNFTNRTIIENVKFVNPAKNSVMVWVHTPSTTNTNSDWEVRGCIANDSGEAFFGLLMTGTPRNGTWERNTMPPYKLTLSNVTNFVVGATVTAGTRTAIITEVGSNYIIVRNATGKLQTNATITSGSGSATILSQSGCIQEIMTVRYGWLTYTGLSGTFVADEVLNFSDGKTARVAAFNSTTSMLTVYECSSTISSGTSVTGATSGATCTVSAVAGTNALGDVTSFSVYTSKERGTVNPIYSVLTMNSGLVTDVLTGGATLNFGTIAAGAVVERTITITGLRAAHVIEVTPTNVAGVSGLLTLQKFRSADDTLTIRLGNPTAASIAVTTQLWRVVAWGF